MVLVVNSTIGGPGCRYDFALVLLCWLLIFLIDGSSSRYEMGGYIERTYMQHFRTCTYLTHFPMHAKP